MEREREKKGSKMTVLHKNICTDTYSGNEGKSWKVLFLLLLAHEDVSNRGAKSHLLKILNIPNCTVS